MKWVEFEDQLDPRLLPPGGRDRQDDAGNEVLAADFSIRPLARELQLLLHDAELRSLLGSLLPGLSACLTELNEEED